ncbi:peptidylprolyl isomerase [Anianabacter salinae]|uniref:peptidylprolyl isomerase n=1 Tax=Anianabacter salinae TaxID=2851023 RepID=UPI00225E2CC4|nr:peptidylprolyl isomerase [Anianabacter salinae]MBV0913563.1 peptidylprolyl isomerase [Anianabacter salinae]
MPIRTALKLGTALALGLATPTFAQDTATEAATADPAMVLATVNGTDITLGHMIALKSQLPQQYQELPDDVLFDGVLEQLIRQTAMADTVTEAPRAVELRVENERRALLAQDVVNDAAEGAVTDEAVQQAYEAAIAEFEGSTEYNAAHILVETEEEAQTLVEQAQGDADFAELAKEHSTGPSGPNGGALGWFGPGMMVQPFDEAVQGMEPGDVAGPVQTQFGWHVIKLNETRTAEAPSLDELRPEIEAQLREQAVAAKVEEITAAAEVERAEIGDLDPSVLSNLELLSQ